MDDFIWGEFFHDRLGAFRFRSTGHPYQIMVMDDIEAANE